MGHLKSGTMHTKTTTGLLLRWRKTVNDPLYGQALMEIQKQDAVVSASLEA